MDFLYFAAQPITTDSGQEPIITESPSSQPMTTRGGSRTSIAGGGALVTNEAEGFTEARSAERGRVGEWVTPSRWWVVRGGLPREILGKLHQNGAF